MTKPEIAWQVRGYEWGLNRPLVPLTAEEDIEREYYTRLMPDAPDWRDTAYQKTWAHGARSNVLKHYYAFRRGVFDAMPLICEDGGTFSLSQIAVAIRRNISYVRAEIKRGKLKATRDGKLWYVYPEDFVAWYRSKRWRQPIP